MVRIAAILNQLGRYAPSGRRDATAGMVGRDHDWGSIEEYGVFINDGGERARSVLSSLKEESE